MTKVDYRYIAAGFYPGAVRHFTERLDFLHSVSIRAFTPDGKLEN